MKAIVFGATGLVGRWVHRDLLEHGWSVLGTCHSRPLRGLLPFDLGRTDLREIVDAGDGFSCGIICAGIANIDLCKKDPGLSRRVNVDGTKRLIQQLRGAGIKPVFCSSDYVFSGLKGGYVETDQTDPITLYGEQKVAVEGFLLAGGGDFLVLRFSKIYSALPSDDTMLSQWHRSMKEGRLIRCASDQVFCPTLVDDVARGVRALIETGRSGIYHLCHPEKTNRLGMLMEFARVMGMSGFPFEEVPTSQFGFLDRRGLDTSMRPDRFLSETGIQFTPRAVSFERFCERTGSPHGEMAEA